MFLCSANKRAPAMSFRMLIAGSWWENFSRLSDLLGDFSLGVLEAPDGPFAFAFPQ